MRNIEKIINIMKGWEAIAKYLYNTNHSSIVSCMKNIKTRRATGTAFDGAKNERVDPSSLFTRWKEFGSDPFFLSIFKDTELVSLSREIFGDIEGTDAFY